METTQHQQVPAWLNPDLIASPELREEISSLIQRVRDIIPTLEAIGADARRAFDAAHRAEHKAYTEWNDIVDDEPYKVSLGELLSTVTGSRVLYSVLLEARDPIDPEEIVNGEPTKPVEVGALRLDGASVEKLQSVARRAPMVQAQAAHLAREAWEALRPQLEAANAGLDGGAGQRDVDEFDELTGARDVKRIAYSMAAAWLPASTVYAAEVDLPEWYDVSDMSLIGPKDPTSFTTIPTAS